MWVRACKCFLHPSLVILLFGNNTHEPQTGRASSWGDYYYRNSKPPGRIIMMGQSETFIRRSQIIFIYRIFVCRCTALLLLFFSATAKCALMLSRNQFLESSRHILPFFHPILVCRESHTEHRWRLSNGYNSHQKILVLCPFMTSWYLIYKFTTFVRRLSDTTILHRQNRFCHRKYRGRFCRWIVLVGRL
jgi:hypothetical protein